MSRKTIFKLFTVLTFGLIILGFSSCGGGDSEEENKDKIVVDPVEEEKETTPEDVLRSQLVGTWEFQEATASDGTKLPKTTVEQLENLINQLTGSETDIETLSFTDSKVNGMEYTVEGNKLILAGAGNLNNILLEVKDINEENLTLYVQVGIIVTVKATILYKKLQQTGN